MRHHRCGRDCPGRRHLPEELAAGDHLCRKRHRPLPSFPPRGRFRHRIGAGRLRRPEQFRRDPRPLLDELERGRMRLVLPQPRLHAPMVHPHREPASVDPRKGVASRLRRHLGRPRRIVPPQPHLAPRQPQSAVRRRIELSRSISGLGVAGQRRFPQQRRLRLGRRSLLRRRGRAFQPGEQLLQGGSPLPGAQPLPDGLCRDFADSGRHSGSLSRGLHRRKPLRNPLGNRTDAHRGRQLQRDRLVGSRAARGYPLLRAAFRNSPSGA